MRRTGWVTEVETVSRCRQTSASKMLFGSRLAGFVFVVNDFRPGSIPDRLYYEIAKAALAGRCKFDFARGRREMCDRWGRSYDRVGRSNGPLQSGE